MNTSETLAIILGEAIKQLGGRLRVDDKILVTTPVPYLICDKHPEKACRYFRVLKGDEKREMEFVVGEGKYTAVELAKHLEAQANAAGAEDCQDGGYEWSVTWDGNCFVFTPKSPRTIFPNIQWRER